MSLLSMIAGLCDNGIDFVGRLDVGDGREVAKLVVLGQAKCERTDAPTNGVHLARTVARSWVMNI